MSRAAPTAPSRAPRRPGAVAARATGALLLVAVALLPFQGLRQADLWSFTVNDPVDRADGLLVADVALGLAVLAAAVALVRRRCLRPAPPRLLLVGLGLLLVGGLVGLVFAETPDAGALLGRTVAVVVGCAAVVWAAAPGHRGLRLLFVAFTGSATASALLGLGGVLAPGALVRLQSGTGRAVGLAGNAGALGVFTALALVLTLVVLLDGADRRRDRVLLVGALCGQVAGLLSSGTRGAALAVVVVAALLAVRAVRTGRARGAASTAAVVALVVVVGVLGVVRIPTVERFLLRTDTPVAEGSATSAEVRWDQVDDAIRERGADSLVVGGGLADLEPTAESVRRGSLRDPHSGHLEVWLGLGVVGLAGWVLVAVATVAPGARLLAGRSRLRPGQVPLAALGAAYATFVLLGFTANNVWNRYLWLLVALAALEAGRAAALDAARPAPAGLPAGPDPLLDGEHR